MWQLLVRTKIEGASEMNSPPLQVCPLLLHLTPLPLRLLFSLPATFSVNVDFYANCSFQSPHTYALAIRCNKGRCVYDTCLFVPDKVVRCHPAKGLKGIEISAMLNVSLVGYTEIWDAVCPYWDDQDSSLLPVGLYIGLPPPTTLPSFCHHFVSRVEDLSLDLLLVLRYFISKQRSSLLLISLSLPLFSCYLPPAPCPPRCSYSPSLLLPWGAYSRFHSHP